MKAVKRLKVEKLEATGGRERERRKERRDVYGLIIDEFSTFDDGHRRFERYIFLLTGKLTFITWR